MKTHWSNHFVSKIKYICTFIYFSDGKTTLFENQRRKTYKPMD